MPAKPMTDAAQAAANSRAFRILLDKSRLGQKDAADLIQMQTGRPCAYRTVKAWVADSEAVTYRPCPAWAVTALSKAVANPDLMPAALQGEPA